MTTVERNVDVRTAEAVAVHFELAGLGSRFLALAADLAIQLLVALAALVALILFGLFLRSVDHSVATPAELKLGYAILAALGAIGAFVLFCGYFIVFELVWNGQTPGKRALGIRVVRDAGFPVDVGAAVIRNVVRLVEFAFGFYVVSALVTLLSPENKRPGDFAAGTIVVRDRPDDRPVLDALLREDPEHDDGLDRDDRALIAQYLTRRMALEPRAAAEIAARIALRVRPKLRASFHYLDDVALLEHLSRSR